MPSTFPFPAAAELKETLYPQTSRYHGLDVRARTEPAVGLSAERKIAYLARRFVPSQDRFETLREHIVTQGDRPDLVAYRHFGDAEQFWRVCDANNDLDPFQLTATAGRRIRITLPEGIPGAPHA